jgi:hypothetical protein
MEGFKDILEGTPGLVVIDFTASWCKLHNNPLKYTTFDSVNDYPRKCGIVGYF